jgi:hypothetical protein
MAEIGGHGFGRVTIDGRAETRDVIALPERVVRGWWRKEGHRLVLEDLDEVLDELPERLLVGTARTAGCAPIRALWGSRTSALVCSARDQAARRYSLINPPRICVRRTAPAKQGC